MRLVVLAVAISVATTAAVKGSSDSSSNKANTATKNSRPTPILGSSIDRDKTWGQFFPDKIKKCYTFVCKTPPLLLIPNKARCDGKPDCADASDEMGCLACNTVAWCQDSNSCTSRAPHRICLRSEKLCDGIEQCPGGLDESAFCRDLDEACPEGTVRCRDRRLCLPVDSICDGHFDCPLWDDEEECSADSCKRDSRWCGSGASPSHGCIPATKVCDGLKDCPDGSDEIGCDCRTCVTWPTAACPNGRCLRWDTICDSTVNCIGGTDEAMCPDTCSPYERMLERGIGSSALSPVTKTIACLDGRMYPRQEACTGLIPACATVCCENAFECRNKLCIPMNKVCDEREDCADGEDEDRGYCTINDCFPNKPEDKVQEGPHIKSIRCQIQTGRDPQKCITPAQRCNAVRDCPHGEDELNCDEQCSGGFHCRQSKSCIPLHERCDGRPDCEKGEDEAGCVCHDCERPSSPMCSTRPKTLDWRPNYPKEQ